MIISKASLGLVELCRADKFVPVLNQVCIEPDGTVVATNGKVVAAISPVTEEVAQAVPLPGKTTADVYGERILLSAETAKELIKAIPRDTQFKGILEHCCLFRVKPGDITVKAIVTDGKRKSEMTLRTAGKEYVNYRKVFQEAWATVLEGSDGRVVMNRKRMALAMAALEKACPYDGDFSPVFWQFTKAGNVLVRAENEINKQRFTAVFSTVDLAGSGEWLGMTDWERKLMRKAAVKL